MTTSSKQKFVKGRISPSQIKVIHTLVGAIGMDRDAYEELMQQVSRNPKVASCTALSWREADTLIDELQRKKGEPPKEKAKRPLPFADLDGRPGMASGAQCRLMAAMWSEVTKAESVQDRAKALDRFIKRIVGVETIRFVKGFQVEKVVKAIEAMKKNKEVADDQKTDEGAGSAG